MFSEAWHSVTYHSTPLPESFYFLLLVVDTTAILRTHEPVWPGNHKVTLQIRDQQGEACPDLQELDVSVCTCDDTEACSRRGAGPLGKPGSKLGPAAIGLGFLGALLLLRESLFLPLFLFTSSSSFSPTFLWPSLTRPPFSLLFHTLLTELIELLVHISLSLSTHFFLHSLSLVPLDFSFKVLPASHPFLCLTSFLLFYLLWSDQIGSKLVVLFRLTSHNGTCPLRVHSLRPNSITPLGLIDQCNKESHFRLPKPTAQAQSLILLLLLDVELASLDSVTLTILCFPALFVSKLTSQLTSSPLQLAY